MTSREGMRMHGALLRVGERSLDTVHGAFRAVLFHDLSTDRAAIALLRGDVRTAEPLLCRVHSSCVTSEMLGACDCDCAEQLDAALEAIDREGRGVLFYLVQEGRGAGLAAKASDRMIVQASGHRLSTFEAYEELGLGSDHRHYDSVAAALEILGIGAPLRLLTNNPEKMEALERAKVRVFAIEALERTPSPFNAHYLGSKRASGHVLAEHDEGWAEPPGPVERISPERIDGDASLFRIASYWLPVPIGRRLPDLGSRRLPDLGSRRLLDPGSRRLPDSASRRLPDSASRRLPDSPRTQRSGAEAVSWLRANLYLDLARRSELVSLEWAKRSARTPVPIYAFGEGLFDRLPLAAPRTRERWHGVLARFTEADSGLAVFGVAATVEGSRPDPSAVAAIVARHVDSNAEVLAVGEPEAEDSLRGALRACGLLAEP